MLYKNKLGNGTIYSMRARDAIGAFCAQASDEDVRFDALLAKLTKLANDHV